MKKSTPILTALFAMSILAALALSGCEDPNDTSKYEGKLIIDNSPSGYSFYVLVYPSHTLPKTYTEYSSMTTSLIAAGNGTSSLKITWKSDAKKTGNYLTTVRSGSTEKMKIISFNKGSAKVDWSTMSNSPSPY